MKKILVLTLCATVCALACRTPKGIEEEPDDFHIEPGTALVTRAVEIPKKKPAENTDSLSDSTMNAFLELAKELPESDSFVITGFAETTNRDDHPFHYTNGVMRDLMSGRDDGFGLGINAAGHVAGYYSPTVGYPAGSRAPWSSPCTTASSARIGARCSPAPSGASGTGSTSS